MDPLQALIAVLSAVPVFGPVLPYVPGLIALCAILDAVIPQPVADSAWVPLRRIVAMAGGSFGYARNAVPAGAVPASVAAHVAEVRQVAAAVETAAGTLAQAVQGQDEAVPSPKVPGPYLVPPHG